MSTETVTPETRALCAAIRAGRVSSARLQDMALAIAKDGRISVEKLPASCQPASAVSPGDRVEEPDTAADGISSMNRRRRERENEMFFERFGRMGVGAVDKAMAFAAEWRQLQDHGLTRMSCDSYVANNMARLELGGAL